MSSSSEPQGLVAIPSDDSNNAVPSMPPIQHTRVRESPGNLFDTPEGAALIHACNAQGVWGAGIARAFRERYPAAYQVYRTHCRQLLARRKPNTLINLQSGNETTIRVWHPLGTALIIPPQQADLAAGKKRHWIVCLFTSGGYGRQVDPPNLIVNSTYSALCDLKRQLQLLDSDQTQGLAGDGDAPTALYSCRFNSGMFGVSWDRTWTLLDAVGLDVMVVYAPGEEVNDQASSGCGGAGAARSIT